jgi:hypothetical protein
MKNRFSCRALVALAIAISCAVSTQQVRAESELIVRAGIPFEECPAKIEAFLEHINADERNVRMLRDTGAHYRLKLIAESSNLVFFCNAVTESIEVRRTTPGELEVAAK